LALPNGGTVVLPLNFAFAAEGLWIRQRLRLAATNHRLLGAGEVRRLRVSCWVAVASFCFKESTSSCSSSMIGWVAHSSSRDCIRLGENQPIHRQGGLFHARLSSFQRRSRRGRWQISGSVSISSDYRFQQGPGSPFHS